MKKEIEVTGRCWWPLRWHPWTTWEVVDVEVYYRGRTVDSERQVRRCQRCGLTETRPL